MSLTEPNASRRAKCNPKPFERRPRALVRKVNLPGEGYVFGRPTKYKPEYCQLVADVMGEGYSLTAFAGMIGVAKDTVYEWIAAYRDFSAAVNAARAARVSALETKLLTTQIGVGVTAAIFALKNADPDEWRDIYQNETNINVSIRQLSDEQLLQIAASGRKPLAIEHNPDELPQADERQPVADDK